MKIKTVLFTTALTALSATAATAQITGPSTATEPYVLPSTAGVSTVSILTTGESVGGYRMAGIPDGLGAWEADDGLFNVVFNHEIEKHRGVVRAHGAIGAFVSRWEIDGDDLSVLSGRDHMTAPTDMHTWNGTGYTAGPNAMDRLCSADLAAKNAYHGKHGLGTAHRIFLSGEEDFPPFEPDHGRMFAHIVSGPEANETYELPRLGKASWENGLASPHRQDRTVVMLTDDAGRATNATIASTCRALRQPNCSDPPSELYMYVGNKQHGGNEIERAGLTNGLFYGMRVIADGLPVTGESATNVFGSVGYLDTARFEMITMGAGGDVSNTTGVASQDVAITRQVTQFIRIEDGAWDPRPGHERDFYFVTTGRITVATWLPSRLWRVRFDDISQPELGGTVTMVLSNAFETDTTNGAQYQMFDNLAIDGLGRAILQEDVGSNVRLGRIYAYGLDTGTLVRVAAHNPQFFTTAGASFQTIDEESSAAVDASDFLGEGWFVLVSQNHRVSPDPELGEGGQLLAMFIDPEIALE